MCNFKTIYCDLNNITLVFKTGVSETYDSNIPFRVNVYTNIQHNVQLLYILPLLSYSWHTTFKYTCYTANIKYNYFYIITYFPL